MTKRGSASSGNPSHLSFGWGRHHAPLAVRAAGPRRPRWPAKIVDQNLEALDLADSETASRRSAFHTGNALRGYERDGNVRERGSQCRVRRNSTPLVSRRRRARGRATRFVRGDGDSFGLWCRSRVTGRCRGRTRSGVSRRRFVPARWEMLPEGDTVGIRQTVAAVRTLLGWRCGDRRPETATARAHSLVGRSSTCVAAAFGSWRSRRQRLSVTLPDLAMAERRRTWHGSQSYRVRPRIRADGALAELR